MSTNHALAPAIESFYKYLLELDLTDTPDLQSTLRRAVRFLAQVTNAETAYLEINDFGHQIKVGEAPGQKLGSLLAQPSQLEVVTADSDGGVESNTQAEQQPLATTAWRRLAPIAGIIYLRRATPFAAADREVLELFGRRVTEALLQCHRVDGISLEDATMRFRRQQILATLERTKWNVSKSARELVVARSYLYKLIQALNLRSTQSSNDNCAAVQVAREVSPA